ncbi:serine hydrolase domain-containing protein [Flammeovirgaceae bacterium SG7u.111]|nr:serine hydrolase domain-containing protein [Flammeovirgaceae bacterium SG7u.132]WPO38200.1 serine hydrolase domain-containing protein [Flammeovirgaceae bacterium SG7u.111]
MFKRLLIFTSLGCILYACTSPKATEVSEEETPKEIIDQVAIARLDSTLQSFVEAGKIAGISALIYEKGEEKYFKALGYSDREDSIPMARNTLAIIYSMTKPVTGAALMTLYDEGKFQLDDPLSKYLPAFANPQVYTGVDAEGNVLTEPANRPITIRDITRHTAGFVNRGDIPGLGKMWNELDIYNPEGSLAEMGKKLSSIPLWYQPGTQWEYGISVDIQALLVETIAGKPYKEYLRENVLAPLGMDETRYYVPETDIERLTALYHLGEDGVLNRVPDEQGRGFHISDASLTPGGWGLTSTLDDYTKLAQMYLNKGTLNGATILQPETVTLMSTSHLPDSITERSWLPSKGQVGFGIDFAVRVAPPANAEENNGVVGEFFWDGAASTLFWVDPVNELTAVMFVQLFPYDQIGLHKGFRNAIYGPFEPVKENTEM